MRAAILCILLCLAQSASAADLLFFSRSGCSACDRAKAALASDPELVDGHNVVDVDVLANPRLARRYRVRAVPVFVLERRGRIIARKVGWLSAEEFRAWLQAHK